jgi:16S rRNA (adenine1518-N6/adenine1519-N6)-dimethyltransferase
MNNNRPRKRFGQHFLHDRNILDKMIAAIHPEPGQHFIEIGPGRGAMTRLLIESIDTLHVIEIDRDLAAALPSIIPSPKLTIHEADALSFDFGKLRPESSAPLRLAGNLPYNISTPLLFHLLEQHHCIKDMHFMLQKEVVERMAASPGSRQYGRLSIMLQYRCRVTPLFNIGPESFDPPPKVDSAFVRLEPFEQPRVQVTDVALFEKLVKQAFSQRRKTLRNTLRDMLDAREMTELGIDPSARAETLAIQDFATLANHLSNVAPSD